MTIVHRLPALSLLLVLTLSAQAVPLQPTQTHSDVVDQSPLMPVRVQDWPGHPLTTPSITSASIATGTVSVPFSYTLTATGTLPITLTAINLPAWATLDSPVISGIPDATGIYSVTLTAVNSDGTDQKTLTISIGQVFTTYVPVFLEDYPDIENADIVFVSDRDGHYEIYTMDVNGNNVRRLTYTEGDNINPDWSPDGTKIVFSSNRSGAYEIYTMNADGSNQAQLTHLAVPKCFYYWCYMPQWSPDGSRIAFSTSGINIMNSDGTGLTQVITSSNMMATAPFWSPHGSEIGYLDEWSGISVMNADGTDPTRVVGMGVIVYMAWSPDGRRFAFSSGWMPATTYTEIYIFDRTTSIIAQLTTTYRENQSVDWSPDGSYLIFNSDRTNNFEIYRMTDSGSQVTNLTNNPAADSEPDWKK